LQRVSLSLRGRKRFLNTLTLRKLRELNIEAPSAPGRPRHLSAASGLVVVHSIMYVVADDEQHLGVFPLAGDEPGKLLRVVDGDLPHDKAERKRLKADFETLLLLPSFGPCAHGALFAIGSGSKRNREQGVLLPLNMQGVAGKPRVIDLSLLFATFAARIGDLNLEGAVIVNDRLSFLQRGNKGGGINAVISVKLDGVLKSLNASDGVKELSFDLREYELAEIDGVPLAFTDGAALPDGRVVFTAVAEDSDNSYADGKFVGAAVGVLGMDGHLQKLERLSPDVKVEGIDARVLDDRIQLLLVTDADDPSVPASLYAAEIDENANRH
jgi:hypothetical protein